MTAYYNENDPAAVHVLRAMIAEGVIAPGDVDDRSIQDVQADELEGYTQCHFFAGGGLWSVAARLAGWPDTAPLWTASCPCQPYSAAGKGLGADDPRHLWPDLFRLIRARRPSVCVGEQVAGKAGYGWFDGVRADLAGEDYASRSVDFPACSVDAPHQRNRQYWIAMADGIGGECERRAVEPEWGPEGRITSIGNDARGGKGTLVHGIGAGLEGQSGHGDGSRGPQEDRSVAAADGRECRDGRNGTYWSDAEWIICHDGKARRAQPGIRFLVDGLPGRVDLWRVGGNAIVPQAAAEVIGALVDVYPHLAQPASRG